MVTDILVALATSVGPLLGLAVGYIAGRRSHPKPPPHRPGVHPPTDPAPDRHTELTRSETVLHP